MKRIKPLLSALSAVGLLAMAAPGHAAPTLTFDTQAGQGDAGGNTVTADPFGGFDFTSNGTAVTSGLTFDGTEFTTTFWATASGINSAAGGSFFKPFLDSTGSGSGYEFTVLATITETASCNSADVPCTDANFFATGGTFQIWYDPISDANLVTGAGITDGTLIISGEITPGFAGSFTLTGPTDGEGNFSFDGLVTFTNNDFINPDLATGEALATIQIGDSTTAGWLAPTGMPGAGGGTAGLPGGPLFIAQADANSAFAMGVPEPATVALLGVSLLGIFGSSRRRNH